MTAPNPSPEDAFQRAAEELWTPVFRFALALTNDLSDADDLSTTSRCVNGVRTPVSLSVRE